LGGIFGIHKFVQRKIKWGFAYLFTFGLFGIGWIYDIIQEYKKWPETPQRNVVKWGVFALFIILAISEIGYSFFATVLYVLAAILSLDTLWNKVNVKKVGLRVGVPLILFIIATKIGSGSIPESSYGTWICQGGCDYEVIEFNSDEVKVYKSKSADKYLNATSTFYDSKIYVSFDDGTELIFSYDAAKEELCLMNNVDLCSIIYEHEEKENLGS
jgi:hypothetical protein